jgi:hypothetical protein
MPIYIAMSGPVRPSEVDVLSVINSMRRQTPNSRICLCTWKGQLTEAIQSACDLAKEIPEPTEEYIDSLVYAKTLQQRELAPQIDRWTYSIYKMIYGVQSVCEMIRPYVSDDDIVIRIRTDSMFEFQPEYLQSLLTGDTNRYIAKQNDGFDWFAITTFSTLWNTWYFSSIQEYNEAVNRAWNSEAVIISRVPVPIQHLDRKLVDMYIIRENGQKQYFD